MASEVDDAIYAIPNAATVGTTTTKGTLVVQDATHMHGPLGLLLLPNGNLLVANADSVNVDPNASRERTGRVHHSPPGPLSARVSVDPNNGGAFGLALNLPAAGGAQFAAVDDNGPTISVWGTPPPTRSVSLGLAVTPSAPSVTVGQTVSFSVTVTNTGTAGLPADTTAVTVTLPNGLTTTGPLSFPVGALPVGQSVTFTVHATATGAGSQTVSASITSPDTANTTTGPVTATVTVAAATTTGTGTGTKTTTTNTLPPLVVGGQPNGSAVVFDANPSSPGQYSTTPAATINPFGNIGADVRVAEADVNGDGVPDEILVTGPGVPIRVAVVDGATGAVLVQPFDPFGGNFTGGGFVAAGDFTGTGKADIVVTPDQGGGPRVEIFSVAAGGQVQSVANFLGINDPNFRGGARVAVGDINGDGTPDLVVAAGFGGGPRVAIYDGKTVLTGTPARLVPDFFAFPGADAQNLRIGVTVAVGDLIGDGFGDLIIGAGPGGRFHAGARPLRATTGR